MIAYIEDNIVDFERIAREIPVKRFVRLKDFLDSKEQFNLVICDLSLPDAYGPEILEEMKGKNVVILTGLASLDFPEAKRAMEDKGFQHVLSKDDPNIIKYIKNLIPEQMGEPVVLTHHEREIKPRMTAIFPHPWPGKIMQEI